MRMRSDGIIEAVDIKLIFVEDESDNKKRIRGYKGIRLEKYYDLDE